MFSRMLNRIQGFMTVMVCATLTTFLLVSCGGELIGELREDEELTTYGLNCQGFENYCHIEYVRESCPQMCGDENKGNEDYTWEEGEEEQARELIQTTMYHSADTNQDWVIGLSELLRVIQFFNSDSYHCAKGTEDGYNAGPGSQDCSPHNADQDKDWNINLSEILRVIQFYNAKGYHRTMGTEDNFDPGTAQNSFFTVPRPPSTHSGWSFYVAFGYQPQTGPSIPSPSKPTQYLKGCGQQPILAGDGLFVYKCSVSYNWQFWAQSCPYGCGSNGFCKKQTGEPGGYASCDSSSDRMCGEGLGNTHNAVIVIEWDGKTRNFLETYRCPH